MLLGKIIQDLGQGDLLISLLNNADQTALVERLEKAAHRNGEGIGDYAAASIERFTHRANDEAWLKLMSALEKSTGTNHDPGALCLHLMLDWALREETHRHDCANPAHTHSCSCA